MIKEVSVGAIVYRRTKKVIFYLLLYRKAHGPYKEAWGFPRGLIEKGETEEDTAKREIKEETGLTDLEFKKGFRKKIHFFYKREGQMISKDVIYLLAETKSEKVKLSYEHDDFAWLTFDEALKKLTFKNDKEVLRAANDFLTKGTLEAYE